MSHWTTELLEAADGKYLYFPASKSTRLLRKSGRGWKIGVAKQAITSSVALQFLDYQKATLANESLHV